MPDPESGVRPPTFDECFLSWMESKKPQLAEQTAANYVYVYQRFIRPELGELSITAIGSTSLKLGSEASTIRRPCSLNA